MNINIDKLISELKDEMILDSGRLNDVLNKEFLTGCVCQSKIIINKLIALKNKQPEAITEDSHFRKHSVGQSAAGNDISDKGTVLGESSSETQAVGQNEQTKEVYYSADDPCPDCGYLKDEDGYCKCW